MNAPDDSYCPAGFLTRSARDCTKAGRFCAPCIMAELETVKARAAERTRELETALERIICGGR